MRKICRGATTDYLSPHDDIAALYQRYGHALFRRAQKLLNNAAEAEEVMQETFAQYWAARDRFDGRSSLFTYLYRITTNLAIDRVRRRRTAGVQVDASEWEPVDHAASPEARAAAIETLAVLTRGLEEETLMIAVMAHVDGMTQEEIAEATGLSRRTIGTRLEDFLVHTRKRLQRHGAKGD